MAPNTNFNYRIDLKEQPFVPGNYTVKIKVNDGYQDYSWEKHLVIQEKLKIQCYRRQPPT